jgi:arylformamidase
MAEIVAQLRRAAAFVAARTGRALLATGHSAGGHLAAMLLADRTVAAALPISGLFDLPPLLQTTIANPLGMDEAEARRLSPAFMPSPGLPIHAVVGGLEGSEYERQSRTIAANWGGTWEILPGHQHFSILDELTDPDSGLVRRAAAMAAG